MSDLRGERGSVWVAVGLMAAGAACTTTPPAIDTDGSTGEQTTGTTTGTTTESTGTTGTTAPTTGVVTTTSSSQCQVASDCISPCAFCYYGTCYEYECPPECYSQDNECPVGELCHEQECVEVAKIPTCERQTLELSAIPLQDTPDGVLLVDLDGDDVPDLVVAEPATGMVEIALGDGAGNFGAGVLAPTGLMGDDQRLAAADFDLDGDPDLAVLHGAPIGELSLLFGQDALFMPPVTLAMGSAPHHIFAGRVDDDATPDVLVVDDDYAITLRTGDGMGGLNDPVATPSNKPLAAPGAGDLDGDGTLELAIPTSDAVSLRRYDHDADGVALTDSLAGPGQTPFNAALIVGLLDAPTLVATRRVNGVGVISLWPAGADANTEPGVAVSIPGGAFAVTTADFDGDGRLDLLVLKDKSSFDLNIVYFNADGPECVQTHTVDHWAAAPRIAVADVDGDGKADIVAGNSASASATLLRSGP